MTTRWTTILTTILALLTIASLAGCATSGAPFGDARIAEFRHPVTGQIERCRLDPHETEAAALGVMFGGLGGVGMGGNHFFQCKQRLEQAGYIRIPISAESQAELDRYDAARAASIKK
jgi:hypothetical protein